VVLLSGLGVLVVGLSAELALTLSALMTYTALAALSYGFEAALRAQRRVKLVLVGTLLEKVVLIGLAVAALLAGLGLLGLGVAYVLSGVARTVFTYSLTLHRFPLPPRWPGPLTAVRRVRSSVPFALNFATLNMVPRLDLVLIAAFSTVSASYYAIGERIVNAAAMIPTVASMTLFPFLSRDAGRRSAAGAVGALGVLGLAAGAAGALLSPALIPFLFGDEYGGAVEVTQVMLLSLPFIFATNGLLTVVNVGRQERRVAKITGPAAIAGLAAILAGQALFGVIGASVAFALRQVMFFCVLAFLALKPAPYRARASDRTMIEETGRV
jgi:O-antigen/teichoic acid export membrane protein